MPLLLLNANPLRASSHGMRGCDCTGQIRLLTESMAGIVCVCEYGLLENGGIAGRMRQTLLI